MLRQNLWASVARSFRSFNGTNIRSLSVKSEFLQFSQFGAPEEVLQRHEELLDAPEANQILVKVLVAPINPADINTIQGASIASCIRKAIAATIRFSNFNRQIWRSTKTAVCTR